MYGSSTIGVKKSNVCIIAVSSFILYTAASSAVSIPTIKFSFSILGNFESIFESTPGAILAAHPDVLESSVSLTSFFPIEQASPSLAFILFDILSTSLYKNPTTLKIINYSILIIYYFVKI